MPTPYPNYFFDPAVTGPGARWSVQNVVISPKNCPEGYEAAVGALRSNG